VSERLELPAQSCDIVTRRLKYACR
jgi:hypothetical protein